ncbi:MAG: GH3 auxin-responsive promoter family protein, partial [Bacteroidaceae bacterium]|nr:GH3 auxin-responsive promoter family protein [Bacteroidaceae bacterium]
PSEKMHYMETYNASEGFFGVQTDAGDPAMSLMIDYGVFYEFIPLDELDKDNPQVLPLWAVETGRNYAMVISTSSGMWRYLIGDTVRFTSCNPYKFVITGRTKSFINAFGEEVIVDNAEKALHEACQKTGAEVLEYTAAPIYMDASGHCRHQWVVEFTKEPADEAQFAQILDEALQRINSDYEAKRYKNITLQPLQLVKARKGLFHDWLESKGRLGGQHKVPRLSNSRQHIEELLTLNV